MICARALALQSRAAATRPALATTRAFTASAIRREIYEDVSADRLASLLAETNTNGRPLLVDFFAEWCGPCKILTPTLKKLAATPALTGGREFDLATIDVDKEAHVAQIFKVRSRPCLPDSCYAYGCGGTPECRGQPLCRRYSRAKARRVYRVYLACARGILAE